MHLDADSARSHALELAARHAAAREQRTADASRIVEVRAETRPVPRLIARTQTHAFQPLTAGYAAATAIGRQPVMRSITTDHTLAVHRPPDDWPVSTRLPRVPA
jgi:hypothetical protein